MQMLAVSEEAHEEEFGRRVAVETPCDEEVGNGDAVGCFLPFDR